MHNRSKLYWNPRATEEPRAGREQGRLSDQSQLYANESILSATLDVHKKCLEVQLVNWVPGYANQATMGFLGAWMPGSPHPVNQSQS